jgi:methylthioribose-1-phosphate isomerase
MSPTPTWLTRVLAFGGVRVAPQGARAHNPAFDVTPARFITGLVTERGVLAVSAGETPATLLGA